MVQVRTDQEERRSRLVDQELDLLVFQIFFLLAPNLPSIILLCRRDRLILILESLILRFFEKGIQSSNRRQADWRVVYLVVTWSLSSQTTGTAQESGRPLFGSVLR